PPGRQAYDRWFLLGEKRNELLTLREVQQYGRDTFGDPDHVSIYGLKPHEWYARGVRILGRTAVECTPGRLARPDRGGIAGAAPARLREPRLLPRRWSLTCSPGRATRCPGSHGIPAHARQLASSWTTWCSSWPARICASRAWALT